MLTTLKGHLAYYGKAAAHTFWQAFLATLLAAVSAGGLDWDQMQQLSVWQKLIGAAAIAGVAAVLSYLKALLVLVPPGSVAAIEPPADEPAANPGPLGQTPG